MSPKFSVFNANKLDVLEPTTLWKNREIKSSSYGTVYRQTHPAHEEGDREFGLMHAIDRMSVNMQLEKTGLRTKIRWKTRRDGLEK